MSISSAGHFRRYAEMAECEDHICYS